MTSSSVSFAFAMPVSCMAGARCAGRHLFISTQLSSVQLPERASHHKNDYAQRRRISEHGVSRTNQGLGYAWATRTVFYPVAKYLPRGYSIVFRPYTGHSSNCKSRNREAGPGVSQGHEGQSITVPRAPLA